MDYETEPRFPAGTPEYEAYRAELKTELGKFARGEAPYEHPETDQRPKMSAQDIGLLREIARWRRANGVEYFQWRPGQGFGVMTEWKLWVDDTEMPWNGRGPRERRQANVTYEPDRSDTDEPMGSVAATRNYYGPDKFDVLPVRTITEAVDILVALGYLPPRFSSAYRAGYEVGMQHMAVRPGNVAREFYEAEIPAVRSEW